MTVSNAVSVRGYQLKKVGRRSARLAGTVSGLSMCALGSYAPADVTSAQEEAVPPSSAPCAVAFAYTEPQQNVHQTMLAPHDQDSARHLSDASTVPVAGGRTKDYCDWWREQVLEQNDLSLFNVRLVGDASSPQLFTTMAHNDLAYCSKWGHNRVMEHKAVTGPLILTMPVLTQPEIVEEAVAGVLSGQISLSLSNVEAVLVLANAAGFVSLETACVDYLCVQAQQMTAHGLSCLAKLADHLGLSSLLAAAAEALIKLPWHKNTGQLNSLVLTSVYKADTAKRYKLLHHPQRGAYTELQILELSHASIDSPGSTCASAIDLESLQPNELHALLGILVDNPGSSDALLRSALKQYRVPEALRSKLDWSKPVRIINDIVLPEQGEACDTVQKVPLPECDLTLCIMHKLKEGQTLDVVSLWPSNTEAALGDFLHTFTIFSVFTSAPYVRLCYKSNGNHTKAGKGAGVANYFGDLRSRYPVNYTGPFTVGVCWQEPLTM